MGWSLYVHVMYNCVFVCILFKLQGFVLLTWCQTKKNMAAVSNEDKNGGREREIVCMYVWQTKKAWEKGQEKENKSGIDLAGVNIEGLGCQHTGECQYQLHRAWIIV